MGASFACLIVMGGAITPIKHIRRRHPEKASEYDFCREKVIKGAGILSVIFFLLGWALYRRGKRLK
jgi:hypothetical protein